MNIRVLSAEERKYTYTQSSQIESQTGLIGHLRADMDASGDGFFTAWEDHIAERNTKDFRLCFDEVINAYQGLVNPGNIAEEKGLKTSP